MGIAFLMAIMCHGVTSQGNLTEGDSNVNTGYCEPVSVDICMDWGYNTTYLPNFLGQTTQSIASSTLSSLSVLLNMITEETCEINVQKFLCSVYVPRCVTETRGGIHGNVTDVSPMVPCQTYCTFVMTQCVEELLHLNPAWTSTNDILNCSSLPLDDCFNPVGIDNNKTTEDSVPSTAPQEDVTQTSQLEEHNAEAKKEDPSTSGVCQRLSIDFCSEYVGYNYTLFPNIRGKF